MARDVEGFAVLHRHYCLASSEPSDISPELPSLSDSAIAARCIICSPLLFASVASCFASCVKKMDSSLTNECYGFLCFIQLRSKSVYLDGAIDLYWMAHISLPDGSPLADGSPSHCACTDTNGLQHNA